MLMNNRLQRLMPAGYSMPTTPDQGVAPQQNPLAALSNSVDATGGYDTPILDQYQKLLANPPNQQDYAPSRTRQVLGALAGLGAGASPTGMSHSGPLGFRYDPRAQMEAQQEVTDAPYNKAMGRYATEAGILQKGAQVEEQAIGQKRGIATLEARIADSEARRNIDQQKADTQAQKERDIYETKNAQLAQQLDEFNQKFTKAQADAATKQGNVEAQLKLAHDKLELTDKIAQIKAAQKDLEIAEATRLHNLEKDKWDRERTAAEARIKAAEEAAKARQQPTVTTTEEKPAQGTFGKMFSAVTGYEPKGKTKVTTKTVTSAEPPKGAKPGGKWVTLPSGASVYQEP